MAYQSQIDENESDETPDEEIRRQLGWYLVPQNNDIVEHDD